MATATLTNAQLPAFYSRPAAAHQLSISIRQLDALIKQGSIPAHRFGRKVVVPRCAIERLAGRSGR